MDEPISASALPAEEAPTEHRHEPKIELQSPFFNRVGLPLCRLTMGILFFLLGPLRVRGKYRVPGNGGVLILSNHIADVDPIIVQLACMRTIYFMAKSELFEIRILGKMIRWLRAFPVRRGEPDRAALRKAVEYLKAGQAVGVFPEGELSEGGELLPLKAGVALIARMADVPVICLGIKGTNRILPYGSVFPKPAFGRVEASWGEPKHFEKGTPAETILAWAEGQFRELTDQPKDL